MMAQPIHVDLGLIFDIIRSNEQFAECYCFKRSILIRYFIFLLGQTPINFSLPIFSTNLYDPKFIFSPQHVDPLKNVDPNKF